jgi:hypothetical protein
MAGGISVDIPNTVRVDVSRVPIGPAHRRASTGVGPQGAGRRSRWRLRPVIGQRWRLERVARAHAAIEERATIDKALLLTDSDVSPSRRRAPGTVRDSADTPRRGLRRCFVAYHFAATRTIGRRS